MQEMFGKGLCITFQEKTNFGLSMLTCKKFWESFKRQEIFLGNGCNGFLDKKPGWPT